MERTFNVHEHPLNIFSFLPHSITNVYGHVLFMFVVVAIIVLLGWLAMRSQHEVPGRTQNIFEVLVGGVYKMSIDIMGEEGRPYVPLIFGIGAYVMLSNFLGLIPGFLPPTAKLNTTAAPALCVFFFYHYIGFSRHGLGYVKHFMGPVIWLAPLMFVIELIGHFARPLSLSMRLFGNIFGEELVIGILFFLVPYFVPLPMMFLGLFTSFLQAYVFMMLSLIYISGALEEAH